MRGQAQEENIQIFQEKNHSEGSEKNIYEENPKKQERQLLLSQVTMWWRRR